MGVFVGEGTGVSVGRGLFVGAGVAVSVGGGGVSVGKGTAVSVGAAGCVGVGDSWGVAVGSLTGAVVTVATTGVSVTKEARDGSLVCVLPSACSDCRILFKTKTTPKAMLISSDILSTSIVRLDIMTFFYLLHIKNIMLTSKYTVEELF
jgi:hypothetical protein